MQKFVGSKKKKKKQIQLFHETIAQLRNHEIDFISSTFFFEIFINNGIMEPIMV